MTETQSEQVNPAPKIAKKRLSWLDSLLAGGALLIYLLYLSGDFFLSWSPLKNGSILPGLGIFWLTGLTARLYLTYPRTVRQWLHLARHQLRLNWPWLALLTAVLLGGFLRWQAVQKPPAPTLSEKERTVVLAAINIVKRSDWRPPDFKQPPLYLYTNTLLTEGLAVQSVGKPGWVQIDDLQAETYLQAYRYLNLVLGLLTILPIYGVAALLFGGRGGAVATLLFAGAWVSYRAAPLLVPQTLAGLLAALAFYLIIWQVQQKNRKWGWFWVGTACGVATAAAYGAVLLLISLLIEFQVQSSKFKVREVEAKGHEAILSGKRPASASILYPLLGWLVGFSGLVSGWLLSLPNFLNGLASIGPAPAGAIKFYFKELAGHDPGLLLGLGGGLLLVIVSSFRFYPQGNPAGRVSGSTHSATLRAEFQVSIPEGDAVSFSQTANGKPGTISSSQMVSLLSFPMLYLLALLIFGPLDGARLALCAPFLALGTAYPIEVAARFIAGRLNDGRHRWVGTATALGLIILVLLLGAVARRFIY